MKPYRVLWQKLIQMCVHCTFMFQFLFKQWNPSQLSHSHPNHTLHIDPWFLLLLYQLKFDVKLELCVNAGHFITFTCSIFRLDCNFDIQGLGFVTLDIEVWLIGNIKIFVFKYSHLSYLGQESSAINGWNYVTWRRK